MFMTKVSKGDEMSRRQCYKHNTSSDSPFLRPVAPRCTIPHGRCCRRGSCPFGTRQLCGSRRHSRRCCPWASPCASGWAGEVPERSQGIHAVCARHGDNSRRGASARYRGVGEDGDTDLVPGTTQSVLAMFTDTHRRIRERYQYLPCLGDGERHVRLGSYCGDTQECDCTKRHSFCEILIILGMGEI